MRFSLNGANYSIAEGELQILENDRPWLISFGSGGPKGDIQYRLVPGAFKFKVTEEGWDLVQSANPAATTNSIPPAPIPSQFVPGDGPRPTAPPP